MYVRGWIQWKKCLHMYVNAKMIPVETILGKGARIKERGRGGWIQVWYIWYIVRIFVNATMYPHFTTFMIMKEKNKFTYTSWVPMANACNPSCLGGKDQEDHGSKPARANSSWDPVLKKLHHKKGRHRVSSGGACP
jgi:hypothetical protein